MDVNKLGLEKGSWLMVNCGKFPSEKNCKLVIMSPKDQKEDLISAAVAHAIKSHGHEDTPELPQQLSGAVEEVEL